MNRHYRNALLLAATMLAGSGAFAQSVAPADTASSDDIIVSAQKRDERLREVPLSVTALSPEQLTASGQTRLQEYFTSVPGLNLMAGTGYTAISIRGLTTSQLSNPVVGIVIDDVPFGGSTQNSFASRFVPDLDPSDLQRIEVLRGPQGTLYGASSLGGLLKYVTIAPSLDATSGRVQAGLNTLDGGGTGYEVRGSFNLPLSDSFAVRASAFRRRDGGYVDNVTTGKDDINSADITGGRIAALWKPNETVSLKLSAMIQKTENNGVSEVDTNAVFKPIFGGLSVERMANSGRYDMDIYSYNATLNVDLGFANLAAITGYSISDYTGVLDVTRNFGARAMTFFGRSGAIAFYDFKTKRFTQEVRLSSKIEGFVDWSVGGFYSKEDSDADQSFFAANRTDGQPNGLIISYNFPSDVREYAVFGDVTLNFTDTFDLQLGGRYARNKQSYYELDSGAAFPVPIETRGKSSNGAFTYVISPRWKITPNHMVYGRVATGYRVGGINAGIAGPLGEYGSDKTTNFELGYKGSALDNQLSFELALFHTIWKDIQLTTTQPVTNLVYVTNGSEARSQGVELSAQLNPSKTTRISVSGAYADAKLTKDAPVGGLYAFDGDRLPYSGKFSGSVSLDQDIPINDSLTASVGGSMNYVGERRGEFVRSAAQVRLTFPDYTIFNLRAGLRQDAWTLNAYVTNLTNKRAVLFSAGSTSIVTSGATNGTNFYRPRTIGFNVSYQF